MSSEAVPGKPQAIVLGPDDGRAFWFLNTLTLNKVEGRHSDGALSIVDHRVPAGYAPPPHSHRHSHEAFLILEGEFEGFCGDQPWQAGAGAMVFLPRGVPHGFKVSEAGPGRALLVLAPGGGFDDFVATMGDPAGRLELPEPVPPDPARVTEIAAAHGIDILPPPR
jgi:quercetin dioxygenase-like cupin family protein